PLVEETVALAQESSPGEMRLVAYVVSKQTAHATSNDLRTFLKDRLPEYMLPTHFVFLDALPLTPNGKVDRRSLPEPTWAEDQQEYEAPRTPIQAGIAQIWAQILHREQVGIHDNFFVLGGHSLLATQVISRVRQTFQVELPLYTLFEAPTVAGLAEQVENISRSEQSQLLPPLSPCSREGLPPLLFAQEGLWFLDQLRPSLAAYNILEAFRLHGPLNISALEQSVHKIIQRHEVLRTTFAMRDGHLVQIIAPELQITLHLSDLLYLAPTEREAEAIRLLKEEARRPFDLHTGEGGSLLRMTLLRLADEAYVFSLVMHHSISDAWSMNIFYRELTALYNACVAGQSSPLPEVDLHAADVAVWQRQWLQGAVLDEQLGYWREHLSDAPALLNLPTDRPRPAVQRFCGAMTPAWTMPQSLVSALHELSQHEGTTLFMTLLAAFQVLLLRSSGQEDLVVGTPISNRSQVEMEGVMGYLLNTLALRCQLGGDPRFCDVLKQVREVALGAYAHQDVPFEKVVEALQPERTLSHSPLFQVMFVLQTATGDLNLTGLQTTPLEVATATAKFDLTLFVMEKGNGLDVSVEYNTDLFDADTIERLVGHYQQILNEIVTQPEQRISTLIFLTEAEQEQLRIWNATGTDYPHVRALHELVEQQVERTPDMIALAFEDQQCTYSELNARANQLAHFLQHLGIGPDTPVGICLERSIEMVVGVLGILKAGGVYVPLDPNYPAERLAFMLSDTQTPVLLTQQSLVGRLPTQDVRHILCLDAEWHTIAAQSNENPHTSLQANNLAYIIYTSGSTGTPKGVAMPHAALVNLFTWQQHSSAFPLGARTLQFASLNFDVASQEIFCTIGFGQTLVLLSESVRRDPLAMLTLIACEGIARLFLPVVVLQQLAECAVTERSLHMPNALREIITAGEQLQITPQVVHLFEMLPNTTLSNHYGPSESHVVSSSLLTGDPRVWPVLPHIGRPIDNVELYVLDTYGQRVPLGVPGDLLIGGTSLARGYLARPDVTAERFIPHPFSSIPGARLYKTGDLACYLPDGNIQFLGRGDTQVKVRGYRIELGEIEAMLATHPCVRESVVIVREDIPTEKRLVAYVVSQDEQAQIATQLRHFLQGKLPEYMIPSAFILLDALPVTANGKVDQRVLPAPEKMEAVREVMYEAPRTPVEEVLVRIWTQVLHKEQVGIRDNFFALGGHSLLATQAISHMRQTFQTDIPLLYLFETPTIAGLAETLLTSETVPGRIAMIATYRQKIERMSGDEKQVFLQKTKNARG
ncbi:MAG: amino acid adenylation domain-containing protein, partial [Ktedonobacteraceae bacterium]